MRSAFEQLQGFFHGYDYLATLALAVLGEETMEITPHLAFFQWIAAMIRKRLADDSGPTPNGGRSRDIDEAVRQVMVVAVPRPRRSVGEFSERLAGSLRTKETKSTK